jgi:plastocyanin
MVARMPSARAAFCLLVALALAPLTGCGDDVSGVRDRDNTLRLRLEEYRITPQEVTVREGRVHLVARNDGRLTHNVAVESFSDSPETDEEVEFGRTATAHAGETVSEEAVIRLRPGRYRLVCTIANHDNLGQYGTLHVSAR